MNIDWLEATLTSLSMSVDCMTIGATDGIKEPDMKKGKLFLLTFFFGFFQYLMPTIGYFILYLIVHFGLSQEVTSQLEKYIPWIAFLLLGFLGVKNIIDWIKDFKAEKKKQKENIDNNKDTESTTETQPKEEKLTFGMMILQSIATSIDALCIGFVYSPLKFSISQSQLIFMEIGLVTMFTSTITTLFGRKIGKYIIRWAGLIAGIVFIGIGLKILIESYL